jgi:subtilisin family serine protease
MLSQISNTGSNKRIRSSFLKGCWMKVLAVALVVVSSICLDWTSAKTADTKRPTGVFTRLSGSESQPAKYVSGELIVKFRGEASAATIASAHRGAGGSAIKTFSSGDSTLHQLKLNPGVAVEDALSKYRQSSAVEYAEPNYTYQFSAIPNDTSFTSLWGLHNTGQSVNGTAGTADVDIDAPEAWDLTTGSANVIIGVVDSGIAYDHPDLAANMWVNSGEIPNDGIDNDGNGFIDDVNGYDFFTNDPDPMDPPDANGNPGHGTHVAGTIAAIGNNSLGVTGVMHTAKLMSLKAGDVTGSLTSAAILQAEDYARVKGARAINASFGRTGGPCSQAEYNALSALNTAGVMFLVAAGNGDSNGVGINNDVTPSYPAQYSVATACGPALPNVITVAAINQNGIKTSFSNFGATSVQIAAPGLNINSTRPTSNIFSPLNHNYDANPAGLGYTFSGTNNSWDFTNTVSLSAPTSLTDSPTGKYLDNTNSFAAGPIFSTVGQRGCRLVGAIRIESEEDVDGVLVDVSVDGGATWTNLAAFSGSTKGQFMAGPLSDLPDRNANNRFRANFVSDDSIVFDGVYLDNVRVNCTSGTPSGATDYQFLRGTSMATPHVTGVVGLVLAANPALTVAQIRNAILNTGVSVPALNGVVSTGRRLNARNAVVSVVNNFTINVTKAGTGTGTVTSSPSGIDCGATCSGSFPSPDSVTLSATHTGGSTFNGWAGGGCSRTGTCVVSTTATVTATFTAAPTAPAPPPADGGGGCTIAQAGTNDAMMPIILLMAIGTLIWRGRRRF